MSKATQAILNKARQDKFLLNITLPSGLLEVNKKLPKHGGQLSLDSLQFSVYGAIVPKVSINEFALPQFGQTMKVSTHARQPYEPLSVKFKVDNNFWNYWVIWYWLNLLNDNEEGQYDVDNLIKKDKNRPPSREDLKHFESSTLRGPAKTNYLDSYSCNMSLFGLDEYENKRIEFLFTGAFPTDLDGITYDYQQTDEIESAVAFSFSQFRAVLI